MPAIQSFNLYFLIIFIFNKIKLINIYKKMDDALLNDYVFLIL